MTTKDMDWEKVIPAPIKTKIKDPESFEEKYYSKLENDIHKTSQLFRDKIEADLRRARLK
jgi:hypothetical protein